MTLSPIVQRFRSSRIALSSASFIRGACLIVISALAFIVRAESNPPQDPAPIRRVFLSEKQLRAELQRSKFGELVQMPRSEFEKMLQTTADAKEAKNNPPRLAKAYYSASLKDAALVNGRGSWMVFHRAKSPGLLPLPKFNLALTDIQIEGETAILGDVRPGQFGLLLNKEGRQSVFFDWSFQGTPTAQGIHFALLVPSSPSSTLDLTLPTNYIVKPSTVVETVSVHAAANPKQRIWRMHFTNRTQVDFTIQKLAGPNDQPVVLAYCQSQFDLKPHHFLADFKLDLEVLRFPIRDLTLHLDPSLDPYSIKSPQHPILRTTITPVNDAKGRLIHKRLTLVFQKPVQGRVTGLRVECFGEFLAQKKWTAPALDIPGAVAHQETIVVETKDGVQLNRWNDGGFRVIYYDSLPRGGEKITLIGPFTKVESQRPGGWLITSSGPLHVRQDLWWQIQPHESLLSATLRFTLAHGRRTQIVLRVPPEKDWKLESLEWLPKTDSVQWWRKDDRLTIDVQPGLTARDSGTINLQFRSVKVENGSLIDGLRPFPFVELPSASVHRTTLAINVDPVFQSSLQNTKASAVTPDAGPWKDDLPDYFFVFRNEPIRGQLLLKSFRNRLRAFLKQKIDAGPRRITVDIDMELKPLLGNPNHVDLFVSHHSPAPLRWSSSVPIQSQQRLTETEIAPHLLQLAAVHGYESAWLGEIIPNGRIWRVTFDRPLRSDETAHVKTQIVIRRNNNQILEAVHELMAVGNGASPWLNLACLHRGDRFGDDIHFDALPICSVLNADRFQGRVTFVGNGRASSTIRTVGLKTIRGAIREDDETQSSDVETRTMVYGDGTTHRFPRAELQTGSAPAKSKRPQGVVLAAELTTFVEPGRPLVHHFRFAVRDWQDLDIPLSLPAQMSRLVGVKTNGVWLERFPYHQSPRGWQINLPLLDKRRLQQFEVLYASPNTWRDGRLWSSPAIPVPHLPVPSRSNVQKWRLAPGLAPLYANVRYRRSRSIFDSATTLAEFWRQGDHALTSATSNSVRHSQAETQLAKAAKRIPLDKGKWTLGDAVHQLYLRQRAAKSSLIVDAYALRDANIHAGMLLGKPRNSSGDFWSDLSIRVVPHSVTPLFSTSQQLSPMQQSKGADTGWLRKQLLDAVFHGRNASGRFVRADVWAKQAKLPAAPANNLKSLLAGVLSDPIAANWSEWVSHSNNLSEQPITLVDRSGFDRVGKLLALLIAVIIWRTRRFFTGPIGQWFALGVVMVLGVGWCNAPFGLRPALTWPFLLVCTAWFIWAFSAVLHRGRRIARKVHPATTALAAVAVAVIWATAQYAGDAPSLYTVYLFGDAENPAKQNVLTPPSLMDALKKMRRDYAPHGDDAVLLRAKYKGTVEDDSVKIDALFDCCSFRDNSTMIIPIAGVQLEEGAFLSGAPVFPIVNQGAGGGYSVTAPTKGLSQLSISFRVPIKKINHHHEMEFSIAKLAVNNLELQFAKNPAEVFVLDSFGSQSHNGARVTARLGRKDKVYVRWHSPGVPRKTAGVLTRELYYWDYTLTHPNVTAILEADATEGEVRRLNIAVPDMEVRDVAVYQVTGQGLERVTKSWRAFGNRIGRRLAIQLDRPVTGTVHIRLDAAPLSRLQTGALALRLPRLLQFAATPKTARMLAYRLTGFDVREESNNLAVTKQTAEKFRIVADQSGLRMSAFPSQVYHFSRRSNVAGLNLELTPPKSAARHELEWTFGPSYADVTASAICEPLLPNHLPLVWDVPPAVVVLDVTDSNGKTVPKWSRLGRRLMVWTPPSLNQSTVRFRGWTKYGGAFKGKRNVKLPVIRLLSPNATSETLRFREPLGISVQLTNRKSLKEESPNSYTPAKPNYSAVVQIQRAPIQPLVYLHSAMQTIGDQIQWESRLQYRVRSGRELTLLVSHSSQPFGDVHVEAPPGFLVDKLADTGQWKITCPKNHPNRFAVKLSGRSARSTSQDYPFPHVTAVGAKIESHLLALIGEGWNSKTIQGVTPVKFPQRLFPGAAAVLKHDAVVRKAWSVDQAPWKAVFGVKPAPPFTKAHPLVTYQRIAPNGDDGWRHVAHVRVFAPKTSQLTMQLPNKSSGLTIEVDGKPHPFSRQGGKIAVKFTEQSGVREMDVRWATPAEGENGPLRFAPLKIVGFEQAPIFGEVVLPRAYRVEQDAQEPASLHGRWLEQNAQADLQLLKWLTENDQFESTERIKTFKTAQRRLNHSLGNIDYLLNTSGLSLKSHVRTTLLQETEKIRKDISAVVNNPKWRDHIEPAGNAVAIPSKPFDRRLDIFTPSDRIYYWTADGRTAGVAVAWEHDAELTGRRNRNAAVIWCLFILGIALPIIAPHAFRRFRAVWPELIWITGLVGCFTLGVSLIGVMLVMYGAAVRIFLMLRWIVSPFKQTHGMARTGGAGA